MEHCNNYLKNVILLLLVSRKSPRQTAERQNKSKIVCCTVLKHSELFQEVFETARFCFKINYN